MSSISLGTGVIAVADYINRIQAFLDDTQLSVYASSGVANTSFLVPLTSIDDITSNSALTDPVKTYSDLLNKFGEYLARCVRNDAFPPDWVGRGINIPVLSDLPGLVSVFRQMTNSRDGYVYGIQPFPLQRLILEPNPNDHASHILTIAARRLNETRARCPNLSMKFSDVFSASASTVQYQSLTLSGVGSNFMEFSLATNANLVANSTLLMPFGNVIGGIESLLIGDVSISILNKKDNSVLPLSTFNYLDNLGAAIQSLEFVSLFTFLTTSRLVNTVAIPADTELVIRISGDLIRRGAALSEYWNGTDLANNFPYRSANIHIMNALARNVTKRVPTQNQIINLLNRRIAQITEQPYDINNVVFQASPDPVFITPKRAVRTIMNTPALVPKANDILIEYIYSIIMLSVICSSLEP